MSKSRLMMLDKETYSKLQENKKKYGMLMTTQVRIAVARFNIQNHLAEELE